MYLNSFARGMTPVDMTETKEFAQLVASAADLGIPVRLPVRYRARNVVVNGLRLHCLEWGEPSAPALLLLHGGADMAHCWDMAALALAARFHVVAVDQRGHGDSEWPRDGDRSVASLAEDARELIAALGLIDPVLIGHSLGGMVAMAMAVADPAIARKIVLVDVGPEIAPPNAERLHANGHGGHLFNSLDEAIGQFGRNARNLPRGHTERTVRYHIMLRSDGRYASKHDSRRWPSEGEGQWNRSSPGPDDIARIICPVLVVRGASSRIFLPDAADRFVRALPDGRLVTVANCGHNVHTQNPRGFLEAISPFLAGADVQDGDIA